MAKNTLPLIILLILLLVSGFIAFKFYSDAQKLFKENASLKDEKVKMLETQQEIKTANAEQARNLKELQGRLQAAREKVGELKENLSGLETDYKKVQLERDDLKQQLAEKPKVAYMPPPSSPKEKVEKPGVIPSYWEDVIRKKAELEALLDDLNKELLDSKSKIAELDKMNKELSLRIDQLSKDKDRLEKDLTFKERTLQIMSKDLVSEKERRKDVSDELEILRDENMQLKQEMIVANDAKLKLQEELKNSSRRREVLEERVSEIEKVLKEKSMVFEQLKDELVDALGTPVGELPQEMPEVEEETHAPTTSSSAVELPPIVVKPQGQQLVTAQSSSTAGSRQKLTGSILAVNARENFVIVDLGEDSGLNPGMQLDVFRGGKHIGIIEVIETRKEISAADITSMGIGDSIKEGDSVISK